MKKSNNLLFFIILLSFSIIFISSCKKEEEAKPIIPEPIAGFVFSPSSAIVGTVVEFTNQSTNASSYKWSSEPASLNSTDTSPSHTFTAAGEYQVTLIATNEEGKISTTTKAITIQEVPKPIASFEVEENISIGEEVTFTNSSANIEEGSTYQWSSSPTGFSSTDKNPTFTFTQQATTFTVTLKVTNPDGESNEVSKTITVSNNPENINGLASQSLVSKINEGFGSGWFTTTRADSVILQHTQGNYRMYNNTAGQWSAWNGSLLNNIDNTKNFELKVTLSKLIALSDKAPSIAFRAGSISNTNDALVPNQDQLYYQTLFTSSAEEPNKSIIVFRKVNGEASDLDIQALNEKRFDSSLSIQEDIVITYRHYEGTLYMFVDNDLYGSTDYTAYKGRGVFITAYAYTEAIWKELEVSEIR